MGVEGSHGPGGTIYDLTVGCCYCPVFPKHMTVRNLRHKWSGYFRRRHSPEFRVDTAVNPQRWNTRRCFGGEDVAELSWRIVLLAVPFLDPPMRIDGACQIAFRPITNAIDK